MAAVRMVVNPDRPCDEGGIVSMVDQNILIMGLDSRRDQQGQPLPQDIPDAMHAGDESSGNYDADVLIVVHMPAGDGPVIAISIPRDDYVDLPGCPTSDCQGKIKAAYRLAYESALDPRDAGDGQSLTASADAPDIAAREQMAWEAGRRAQISAVKHLLQIPIDHFVEITLAAFFQIASVVGANHGVSGRIFTRASSRSTQPKR